MISMAMTEISQSPHLVMITQSPRMSARVGKMTHRVGSCYALDRVHRHRSLVT